jgi:hypothetical protein
MSATSSVVDADEREPIYKSQQVAHPDGTPFYYEKVDLTIPIRYLTAGTVPDPTSITTSSMKVTLIKTGRVVNAIFHQFQTPVSPTQFSSFWSTGTAFGGVEEADTVRIPRRFLPVVTGEGFEKSGEAPGKDAYAVHRELMTIYQNTVSTTTDVVNLGHIAINCAPVQPGSTSYGYLTIWNDPHAAVNFTSDRSGIFGSVHATWIAESSYNTIKATDAPQS